MANGEFLRGEVYWVRMDSGVGYEQGVGRPAVIVSPVELNHSSNRVITCFLTTREQDERYHVRTESTGKTSWVLCDAINTFDISRLGKQIGYMDVAEMETVGDRVGENLGLSSIDEEELREKETKITALTYERNDLKAEVKELKEQLASRSSDDDAYKVEIAMWQRLYEKALDQLVNMKLTSDIAYRQEKKEVAPPKPEEPVQPSKPEEPKDDRVELNSCKFVDLRRIGFSDNMAANIINHRPYKSVEDLRMVPGVTSIMYNLTESKLRVVKPLEPKKPEPSVEPEAPKPESKREYGTVWDGVKVNVNTVASANEITRRTGLTHRSAQDIIKHRPYEKIEDLLNLEHFGKIAMKRYGHMLEV